MNPDLLFGRRVVNRYFTHIDRESSLESSSAVLKDIDCTCRIFISFLQSICIWNEYDLMC